jgi:hypothetical protein
LVGLLMLLLRTRALLDRSATRRSSSPSMDTLGCMSPPL